MTFDLSSLTIASIRAGLVARDFSAVELAESAYARIDAVETDVHAFNSLSRELAFDAAYVVDAIVADGGELPPLAGVPVAFKDNMNLVGTDTTC